MWRTCCCLNGPFLPSHSSFSFKGYKEKQKIYVVKSVRPKYVRHHKKYLHPVTKLTKIISDNFKKKKKKRNHEFMLGDTLAFEKRHTHTHTRLAIVVLCWFPDCFFVCVCVSSPWVSVFPLLPNPCSRKVHNYLNVFHLCLIVSFLFLVLINPLSFSSAWESVYFSW